MGKASISPAICMQELEGNGHVFGIEVPLVLLPGVCAGELLQSVPVDPAPDTVAQPTYPVVVHLHAFTDSGQEPVALDQHRLESWSDGPLHDSGLRRSQVGVCRSLDVIGIGMSEASEP